MSSTQRKKGYVPLQRRLLDGPCFHSGPWTWMLFTWLLARARVWADTITTRKGDEVKLKRGQVLVGTKMLEQEFSYHKFRFTRAHYEAALNRLKNLGEITTTTSSRGTIVSIVRFDELAPLSEQSESGSTPINRHLNSPETGISKAPRPHPNQHRTGTKEKERTGSEDRREQEENSVLSRTHAVLFHDLELTWQEVRGHTLLLTPARQAQILRLPEHYNRVRLLDALDKFKEILAVSDPYPARRNWTFEEFFTPKVLDEVLQNPIERFTNTKRKPNGARSRAALLQGRTPNSAYDGGSDE